jgi:hypothetical protein
MPRFGVIDRFLVGNKSTAAGSEDHARRRHRRAERLRVNSHVVLACRRSAAAALYAARTVADAVDSEHPHAFNVDSARSGT